MYTLLDEISELIYVSDINSYDLLYLNKAGRDSFGFGDNYMGKKCYNVFHGLDAPCPFCTNSILNKNGEFYTWKFLNELTNKEYLLKDKLFKWHDGRTVRVEIAFDLSEYFESRACLQESLDSQSFLLECAKMMSDIKDYEKTVHEVLASFGKFMSAERTFIFEVNGDTLQKFHEWRLDDSYSDLCLSEKYILNDRWVKAFSENASINIADINSIKSSYPDEYTALKNAGIKSIVSAPVFCDGKFNGFIGIVNPHKNKFKNSPAVLPTLCYFVSNAMERKKINDELTRLSFTDSLTKLFNRNKYIIDLEELEKNPPHSIGVVYMDVNGLKQMNDLQGHKRGDEVLINVSEKLRKVFNDYRIYRTGGDEFLALCVDITEKEFLERINQIKKLNSDENNPSAAFGYTWEDRLSSTAINCLVLKADKLMYDDKRNFYYDNPPTERYRHFDNEK